MFVTTIIFLSCRPKPKTFRLGPWNDLFNQLQSGPKNTCAICLVQMRTYFLVNPGFKISLFCNRGEGGGESVEMPVIQEACLKGYGGVLQRVAAYSSVLQRGAACCRVLHGVAMCCSMLQLPRWGCSPLNPQIFLRFFGKRVGVQSRALEFCICSLTAFLNFCYTSWAIAYENLIINSCHRSLLFRLELRVAIIGWRRPLKCRIFLVVFRKRAV